ncbi:MAG TPA: asparagine synthase-related protein [Nitrospira sp.]|nr:asparagine synthase-related protein [Nitrospira sp.]
MSAQYGKWNFDGGDAIPSEQTRRLLAPYGPDAEAMYTSQGVGILCRKFSTTEETTSERQPLVTPSGTVITWDGRLDNREDIVRALDGRVSVADNDVVIVGAAYERWQEECFGRLVGDGAVSIWNPRERLLLLATDVVGTRQIYYTVDHHSVTWSTVLDPLVFGHDLTLDEAYLAGWLSSYPATYRTPYVEIHAVPPASLIRFTPKGHAIKQYWEFDGTKRIFYRTDGEYEEHFRALLEQAVGRRLRANTPILAELSGGMDSSSIVSMADRVTEGLVDTVSYYNNNEPNWDERPWFSKVEERRGKAGLYIDASTLSFTPGDDEVTLWPGSTGRASTIADWMRRHGHRVVLSGIGGDEFLGGVPTPVPELEDLLARGRFTTLIHQLKTWALVQRRPWIYLLREAAAGFLPSTLRTLPEYKRPVLWLDCRFVDLHQTALNDEPRLTLFGNLPSFQENIGALDRLRRQLAATELYKQYPYEKRYPYLDRDLLEFLFAMPREQLVRPGERRSLMRRALRGIVPDEVLDRRRKAYVTRSPLASIRRQQERLAASCGDLVVGSLGIVVSDLFFQALEDAHQGKQTPLVPLLRTLGLERWLRALRSNGFLQGHAVRITPPHVEAIQLASSNGASPFVTQGAQDADRS